MSGLKTYRYYFIAAALFFSNTGRAEIVLPKVLGSNMVLQRNKPLPVWGKADVGEAITVIFDDQYKRTVADGAGNWKVELHPLSASDKPAQMTISGTNKIILQNILVGEVWLCSGQSNMEYTLNKSSEHAEAIRSKGMNAEEFKKLNNPSIRVFVVRRDLNKSGDLNKGWQEAQYQHLKDMSAAGYFFAEKLHQELNVPVGMIASSVSGSRIEPWIQKEFYASAPFFNTSDVKNDDGEAGKFFHGRIGLLAPFAIRGFLWYQGESNCFLNETVTYTRKMELLINNWRQTWNDKNLPFYFVQIAPFYYSKSTGGNQEHTEETLPLFREAQTAALRVPHTAMIVTTDLVDNLNDIHPTYKWEVGRRLALVALGKTYGKKVVYSGPVCDKMKIKGDKIELTFTHTGSGLISMDNKPLDWFEMAGKDGNFVPAKAEIKGDKIIVSAATISSPVAVRFAWNEAAQPNLFNKEGLPAVPFRTDAEKGKAGMLTQ